MSERVYSAQNYFLKVSNGDGLASTWTMLAWQDPSSATEQPVTCDYPSFLGPGVLLWQTKLVARPTSHGHGEYMRGPSACPLARAPQTASLTWCQKGP